MPRRAGGSSHINLPLRRGARRTLERAAAYTGKTLADFIIDEALREAEATIRKSEAIELTADEWGHFETLLLNPPPPNKRLRRALAEHARIVRR